jgi:hypothetical protein
VPSVRKYEALSVSFSRFIIDDMVEFICDWNPVCSSLINEVWFWIIFLDSYIDAWRSDIRSDISW